LAGKTTIAQLVELIRNASLLIGNDSAAIHMAAATQTPSVCILGGGHYGRFLPYQPESRETEYIGPQLVLKKWIVLVAVGAVYMI